LSRLAQTPQPRKASEVSILVEAKDRFAKFFWPQSNTKVADIDRWLVISIGIPHCDLDTLGDVIEFANISSIQIRQSAFSDIEPTLHRCAWRSQMSWLPPLGPFTVKHSINCVRNSFYHPGRRIAAEVDDGKVVVIIANRLPSYVCPTVLDVGNNRDEILDGRGCQELLCDCAVH
jgi:hypothetical protein